MSAPVQPPSEREVLDAMNAMCKESLSPGVLAQWKDIHDILEDSRPALRDTKPVPLCCVNGCEAIADYYTCSETDFGRKKNVFPVCAAHIKEGVLLHVGAASVSVNTIPEPENPVDK